MSLFKTKWIILHIKKRWWEEDLYTLFSYEYGKIYVQKKKNKKEKSFDIGYIVQCEIETKEGKNIHKMKNLKIHSQYLYEWEEFACIHEYLLLIALVKKGTPDGVPIMEVYKVISTLHKQKEMTFDRILLSELKVLDILWILKDINENITVKKILKFVRENKIDTILKLKGIDKVSQESLTQLVSLCANT